MRRHPTYAAVAAAALATPLLAGCGVEAAPAESTPSPPTREEQAATLLTEPVEPEWTMELASLGSEAIQVDGVVMLYVDGPEGPALRALDAETGEHLWEAPATTGAAEPDRSWTPVVTRDSGGTPLTLVVGAAQDRPYGGWAHHLELRAVRTGAVLATLNPTWVSNVRQCGDDICLRAEDNDGTWRDATVDADHSRLDIEDGDEDAADAWSLTENITFFPDEDYLAWEVDGHEAWRTSLSEHLPDGTALEDFSRGASFKLAVDAPYAPTAVAVTFRTAGDTPRAGMFAFGMDDGRSLWSRGDLSLCTMGPAIVCFDEDEDEGPRRLAGLDLTSGETTWEVQLETNPDLQWSGAGLVIPGFLGVVDGAARLLLDEQTGQLVEVPDGAVFGCPSDATWEGHDNARETDEKVQYTGGKVYGPCDVADEPLDVPLSRAAVMTAARTAWRDGTAIDAAIVWGNAIEDPLDDRPAWYYALLDGKLAAYRF